MFGRQTIWPLYLVVFVASGCTMVLELAAGRMLAPFIGVSLYSWTSIIGVVLAGMSLGNYLGGRIADRAPRPQTLGILLILCSLSSFGILVLLENFGTRPLSLPLPMMGRITLLTAILFLLPSCLLGTISPVVVKLALKELKTTGSTVGKIYAFSTVGSIAGTFAAGFVLISWFGTRMVVGGVAVLLVAMGLVCGQFWRCRQGIAIAGLTIFLGLGYWLNDRDAFSSPYWKESNYYSISFFDLSDGDGSDSTVRLLKLDHLVHSFVSLTDPTRLDYGYERVYADILEYMSQTRPSVNALFIGGGGYAFPRYMEHLYPTSNLEVIEIDPEVTRCVYEELGLPRDSRIVTHNMDARMFFNDGDSLRGKYDLILGDAFNDLSIPYHLTTLEFNRKVREAMKPDGFFLANIIDSPRRGSFLRPYVNTLKMVFPHVTIAALGYGWNSTGRETIIVVGSNVPLDPEDFTATLVRLHGGNEPTTRIMEEQQLADYMKGGTDLILTDDHAPVDQLIAVLHDER